MALVTTAPIPDPEPGPERRLAVMPLLIAVLALVVAAVLTAVIVGLATRSPDPVTAPSPVVTPTAPIESSEPVAPPTTAPRPEAGPNECVDELDDSATVDLDSVAVAPVDDGLLVRFTLVEGLPSGEALLGITATGRQDRTVLLAVRLIDGEVEEVFAVNLRATEDGDDDDRGRGNDDDPEVDRFDEDRASVEGRQVVVEFPDGALEDLGREWTWSATASAGDEADRCPADGQLDFAG